MKPVNMFLQDAVPQSPPESDYALVDDALPAGKVHRIKSTRKKEHKGKFQIYEGKKKVKTA